MQNACFLKKSALHCILLHCPFWTTEGNALQGLFFTKTRILPHSAALSKIDNRTERAKTHVFSRKTAIRNVPLDCQLLDNRTERHRMRILGQNQWRKHPQKHPFSCASTRINAICMRNGFPLPLTLLLPPLMVSPAPPSYNPPIIPPHGKTIVFPLLFPIPFVFFLFAHAREKTHEDIKTREHENMQRTLQIVDLSLPDPPSSAYPPRHAKRNHKNSPKPAPPHAC